MVTASGGVAPQVPPNQPGAVFFVDEESRHLLERLRARLPPDYRSVEDRDRSGQYRTHLFVPGATR